jgi:nucleoside-triphosphatase THEP1
MARWALISSESGEGNAAAAAEVVERLAERGIRAAGFLQRRSVDERGAKRFELERLPGKERAILAVHGIPPRGPAEERFCSMTFHRDGFDTARRWIEEDASDAALVVLSGISKLEVYGRGHSEALSAALRRDDKVILLCARASQLFHVVERFGLDEAGLVAALELPAQPGAIDAFVRGVERWAAPGAAALLGRRGERGSGEARDDADR